MSPVLGQAVVVDLGQAEVADPDDALGVEQEVRRLDVAVEDAAGVGVGQGRGDLAADLRHAAVERRGAATRPTRAASRPASRPRRRRPVAGVEPGRDRCARAAAGLRGGPSEPTSPDPARTGRSAATRHARRRGRIRRAGVRSSAVSPVTAGGDRPRGRRAIGSAAAAARR